MAAPRQLAYKDRFVWELEQVVSAIFDDCNGLTDPYIFPDMTTRVPFVMLLSQEQFTTLYSAVLTGADLTYPNSSHDVENLFLQIVNCPMNEFCAALINCLENDPDTLAALMALLGDNGLTGGVGDPNQPMDAGILGGNLLPAGYTCTDDKAFGMALAIVDSINDATTEVLQAIEIATNPVEITAELADNVPGIGMLAIATDIAAWIQNSAHEAYSLAWSTTIRDELACLLWCEFKGSCYLSYDQIKAVYMDAAGVTGPAGNSLEEWLAWLIALPLTVALSTVASVSLLGLLAIEYGGYFGGFALGIRSLETVMQLAEDDTSSDWSVVCDPCIAAWCYFFDFLSVAGGWVNGAAYSRPFGVWVSGEGWESVWGDPGPGFIEGLYMQRTFTQTTGTSIEIKFKGVGTAGPYIEASIQALLLGSQVAIETVLGWPADGTIQTSTLNFASDFDEIRLTVISNPPLSTDLDLFVVSTEVHGTGSNPFGADNC